MFYDELDLLPGKVRVKLAAACRNRRRSPMAMTWIGPAGNAKPAPVELVRLLRQALLVNQWGEFRTTIYG